MIKLHVTHSQKNTHYEKKPLISEYQEKDTFLAILTNLSLDNLLTFQKKILIYRIFCFGGFSINFL